MKVKFIQPHGKYSYFAGDVVDLPEKVAEDLVKSGNVLPVTESATKGGKGGVKTPDDPATSGKPGGKGDKTKAPALPAAPATDTSTDTAADSQ